jgi:hypothetical protein
MSVALKVTNLPEVNRKVHDWFARARQATQEAGAGLAKLALERMVERSPQWSGDFAKSWTVSTGSPTAYSAGAPGYDWHKQDPVYAQGDDPAVSDALGRNAPRLVAAAKATPGTKIFITNAAKHEMEYAWAIENNMIVFRPENSTGHHLRAQGKEYALRGHGRIGPAELIQLRSLLK